MAKLPDVVIRRHKVYPALDLGLAAELGEKWKPLGRLSVIGTG
jgi:hypothetical protein